MNRRKSLFPGQDNMFWGSINLDQSLKRRILVWGGNVVLFPVRFQVALCTRRERCWPNFHKYRKTPLITLSIPQLELALNIHSKIDYISIKMLSTLLTIAFPFHWLSSPVNDCKLCSRPRPFQPRWKEPHCRSPATHPNGWCQSSNRHRNSKLSEPL